MRSAVLAISGVAAVFFLGFLGYTFFARAHLAGLAREFVVVRTVRYAEPVVAVIEETIREPAVRRVLPPDLLRRTERELAAYRGDPRAYISELVAVHRPALRLPVIRNERARRVAGWKTEIQNYFSRTLSNLVRDLRIFAGSNAVAALLAFGVALRAEGRGARRLVWIAGLLVASMAYSIYLYVDGLTFFRILFNVYVGWWYPGLIVVVFVGLYLEYGHRAARSTGP